MGEDKGTALPGNVVRIDEERIKGPSGPNRARYRRGVVGMEVVSGGRAGGGLPPSAECRVGSVSVVAVQPGVHGGGAIGRAGEGLTIGPLA